MILKKIDADWWGISQTSHAWLAGQIARLWGNQQFDIPEPQEELLLAAELHDIGWTDWEQRPEINAETDLPYNFLEMPLLTHIEIWKKGARKALTISRFVAWLVSCHNSYLLKFRHLDQEPEEVRDAVETFLDEQKVLQNQLIQSMLGDKEYRSCLTQDSTFKYQQLLRAWDYFSLVLCMGDTEETEIPEVRSRDDQSPVIIKKDHSEFRYKVKPWPFAEETIKVGCEAVGLKKGMKFDNDSRQMKTLEWELIPG